MAVKIDERSPWVTVTECDHSKPHWELIGFVYQNENESGGNHNIYYTVLDEQGIIASGICCWQKWPDATADEAKAYTAGGAANIGIWGGPFYPDQGQKGAYWAYVENPDKSDIVRGIGLPVNRHVNYLLTYRKVSGDTTPTEPPDDDADPAAWTEAEIRAIVRDELGKAKIVAG